MKAIRFTQNWNGKLNNRVFTTIRKCKSDDDYYGSKVGSVFAVMHADKVLFNATLVSADKISYAEIRYEIKATDTGRTDATKINAIFETFYGKFAPTDKFYILLFEKMEKKVSP